MKVKARYLLGFLLICSLTCSAIFKVTKIKDSLVDSTALTINGDFGQAINGKSYQQDAILTHKNFQYVGYYDGQRHVCLARRRLPAGKWEVIRFRDYQFKSNDAHNTISIGICPGDGTIHMAFDHHVHPLHYRVSQKKAASYPGKVAWNASLFSPVASELEKGKPISVTYPRFLQTPGGGLQFFYRRGVSGEGDRMMVDYDCKSGSWINTRQIDSGKGLFVDGMGRSESRCTYPNGYSYGPDGRLHTTWVWREDSQGSNHDLVFVFSNDQGKTWLNNSGELLSEPANVNSPGTAVVKIGREYGLMNTHGQAIDRKGGVHAVMWHCTDESLKKAGSKPGAERWGPPEARSYHHYRRDEKGEWLHTELPWIAGNRPKLFIDRKNNVFLIYCAQVHIPEGGITPEFANGDLVIAAASAKSGWNDWKIIHREAGPFVNEMLGDPTRWKEEEILSIMVQESPRKVNDPTPLRILDFSFR